MNIEKLNRFLHLSSFSPAGYRVNFVTRKMLLRLLVIVVVVVPWYKLERYRSRKNNK